MELTEDEKWKAVIKCDSSYDGIFYYGVKTTGVFCRPSCKSKEPKRMNIVFFNTAEEACDYGLRPCKRCRPDIVSFSPTDEIFAKAKQSIDNCFMNRGLLASKIKELGISQNYFISLFRTRFDMTPVEYINNLRIEKAKELLAGTDGKILDIALECGFGSLSTFYEIFRRQLKVTPKEYRKEMLGSKDDH